VDRRQLGGFIQQIFSAWDERQIVHGAIGYARELGLAQHPDFGRTAGYLVAWDGECELHDLRLTAGGRVRCRSHGMSPLTCSRPILDLPCTSYWTWGVSVIRL
jgi:hypothetical protein